MRMHAETMAMQLGTMVHLRPRRSLTTDPGIISRKLKPAMPAKMKPVEGVTLCNHLMVRTGGRNDHVYSSKVI